MVLLFNLAIGTAVTIWRLLGTLLTLLTEKLLFMAVTRTVPEEASAADYDILNRVLGSSTALGAFVTTAMKLFAGNKPDPSLKKLQPTILRLSLISGVIFGPIVLPILFDGGLSEFRPCSLPSQTLRLPGTQDQFKGTGRCSDALLACQGFDYYNISLRGCSRVSNLSAFGLWDMVCEEPYTYQINSSSSASFPNLYGSLEIVPTTFSYSLSIFRNGSIPIYQMDLGVLRRIKDGIVKHGLAWLRPPNLPGVYDVVVGVPIVPTSFKSTSITRTVYRSEVACAYTGVFAASDELGGKTYVEQQFGDEVMAISGPPSYGDALRKAAVQYRNWTLSGANWTLLDGTYPAWQTNSSSVNFQDFKASNMLRVGLPLYAGLFASESAYITGNCSDVIASVDSPLIVDADRTCYFVTLIQNFYDTIIPPDPSRRVQAYQLICASAISVGLQRGILSRNGNGTIGWDSSEEVPSRMIYRRSSNYFIPANGIPGTNTPLIEFNLTESQQISSETATGAVASSFKTYHPIPQRPLVVPYVEYQPSSSSFLREILGAGLYFIGSSDYQGPIEDSEIPNRGTVSRTLAVANVLGSSIASSFVGSLIIAPWRNDLVALDVTVFDDQVSATCVDRPVLTAIVVFTVLPLIGSYLALIVGARGMLRSGWRKLRAVSGLEAYVRLFRDDDFNQNNDISKENYRQWALSATAIRLRFQQFDGQDGQDDPPQKLHFFKSKQRSPLQLVAVNHNLQRS